MIGCPWTFIYKIFKKQFSVQNLWSLTLTLRRDRLHHNWNFLAYNFHFSTIYWPQFILLTNIFDQSFHIYPEFGLFDQNFRAKFPTKIFDQISDQSFHILPRILIFIDHNFRPKYYIKISEQNFRSKFSTKISDQTLRPKFLTKISDQNFWPKFLTKISIFSPQFIFFPKSLNYHFMLLLVLFLNIQLYF